MSYTRDIENDLILDSETGEYVPVPVPVPTVLCTLTIIPTPNNSRVELIADGYEQEGDSITVPEGVEVRYTVSCDGYDTFSDVIELIEDTTLDISLTRITYYRLTINPIPEDANVVLTATGYVQEDNFISVPRGTLVNCVVSKEDYIPNETNIIVTEDKTLDVILQEVPDDPYIHIQLLRGTTLKNDEYVGKVGELTYDTEKKNVRVHDGETPGGKIVSADIDNTTITNDVNEKLQTVAVKNQNKASGGSPVLYDWEGTLEEYQAQNIETLHPDWLCYINDDVEGGISVYTKTEIDREVVHKTQNETISGAKTFTTNPWIANSNVFLHLKNNDINLLDENTSYKYAGLAMNDVNNNELGYVRSAVTSENSKNISRLELIANDPNLEHTHEAGNRINSYIVLDTDGKTQGARLNFNPKANSNNTQIATTQWVNGNRSNCITEIPQDIKIEFDGENRKVTLKAGSILYVPNGFEEDGTTRKFNKIIIQNDVVNQDGTVVVEEDLYYVYIPSTNRLVDAHTNNSSSGTGAIPSYDTNPDSLYYKLDENKLYRIPNSTSSSTVESSLPIAIVHRNIASNKLELKQVFNGFGYIGSTVFTLPGISALAPYGKNDDGTLRSRAFTTEKVELTSINPNWSGSERSRWPIFISETRDIDAADNRYYIGHTADRSLYDNDSYCMFYDIDDNILYGSREIAGYWYQGNYVHILDCSFVNYKITAIFPDTVQHSVNYSDISVLLNTLYPIGAIYLGIQETCPLTVLLPGSKWEKCPGQHALWISGTGQPAGSTIAAGLPNITGNVNGVSNRSFYNTPTADGAFYVDSYANNAFAGGGGVGNNSALLHLNASRSSSIYGKSSTVQPPAYVVNVWRRTA